MIRPLRLFISSILLAVALCLTAQDTRAQSITFTNTPNTSNYTVTASGLAAGTNYYTVFQLTGGGTDNNSAALSAFNFGGGSALPRVAGDPNDPVFVLSDPVNGIGSPGATLGLTITPADAFSQYAQRFTAGAGNFSFNLSLTNNFINVAPNSPDSFTFQLYDEAFNFFDEVNIPITGIPEPTTLLLTGISLAFAGVAVMRKRRRETEDESSEA